MAGRGFADRSSSAGSRAVYCQTSMTQPTGGPSGAPHVIDTRGDASFTATYLAVVMTEVVVLAALWVFSQYFGA